MRKAVRYSPGNLTTLIVVGLTLLQVVSRFKLRPDHNWPLLYYVFLVAYHQYFPGRIYPLAIYTAVIAALFLRFEFMGGFFRYLFVFIEFAGLAVVGAGMWSAVVL